MTHELALTVLACIAGFVAHELTHYTVALVLARRPSIDWRALETEYLVADGPDLGSAIIRGAPFALGLASAVAVWLALARVPAPVVPTLLGWMVYTLGGIRNDVCAPIWRSTRPRFGVAGE